MKKLLAFSLMLSIAFTMLACTITENNPNNEDQDNENNDFVVQTNPMDSDKLPSLSTSSDPDNSTNQPTNPNTTDKPDTPSITVKENIIFNENDIQVTLKSIEYDAIWGYSLKVNIVNNSTQNITINTENSCVNGFKISTYLGCDVAAGKKANDTITFDDSSLALAQIKVIHTIEFVLNIYDSDSYEDICKSGTIKITTNTTAVNPEFDNSGVTILDDENARIVIQKLTEKDSWDDYNLIVYFENKGKRELYFDLEDISVNDYMIDTYLFLSSLNPGQKVVASISISESDLIENEIDEIEYIDIRFSITDWSNWDFEYTTDSITLTFN